MYKKVLMPAVVFCSLLFRVSHVYAWDFDPAAYSGWGNLQCLAFVNRFLEYNGSKITGLQYDSSYIYLASPEAVTTKRIGGIVYKDFYQSNGRYPTVEEVAAQFSTARPGDIVQMYWNTGGGYLSSQHTAIISRTSYPDGVQFLHSNYPLGSGPSTTGSNDTGKAYWSYATLKRCYEDAKSAGGFSIYRLMEDIQPPAIPPQNFPALYVGADYDAEIEWSGTPPVTWMITSGSLPDGLQLKGEGARLALKGIPQTAGTFIFTVQGENASCKGRQALFTLTVEDMPVQNTTPEEPPLPSDGSIEFSEDPDAENPYIPDKILRAIIINLLRRLHIIKTASSSETGTLAGNYGTITLTREMISQLTELDVSGCSISSLVGINYFTNLRSLNCSNNRLTSLNVTGCRNLTELKCSGNTLVNLYVKGCTRLETLDCSGNNITGILDITGCANLKTVNCYNNQLKWLNITGCDALEYLDCRYNAFEYLSLSGYQKLKTLDCYSSSLKTLVITDCNGLESLTVPYSVSAVNISRCGNLADIGNLGSRSSLRSLTITECPKISRLDCYISGLERLNVSKNPALKYLDCNKNQLTELILEGCMELETVYCESNNFTKLDTHTNTKLSYLYCDDKVTEILCADGDIPIDEVHFPDEKFRKYLRAVHSSNFVFRGETGDLDIYTTIDVHQCGIKDLTGLHYFRKLETLHCYYNELTKLDVSKNPALKCLNCNKNQLTELILEGCTELETVHCESNNFTKLDTHTNTKLSYLYCDDKVTEILCADGDIPIDEVHFPDEKFRKYLRGVHSNNFGNNFVFRGETGDLDKYTTIDVHQCGIKDLTGLHYFRKLETLYCYYNELTKLDVSKNPALKCLNCNKNQLTELILEGCTELETVYCTGNQLTTIDITGCSNLSTFTHDGGIRIIDGSEDPQPEFNAGHALVLDGQIGVIFYVMLPEEPGTNYNDKNCWMTFDIRGDTSNNPQPLDTANRLNFTDANGVINYAFVCYINSAQMADTITATLHYGDNMTLTQESSADAYLTGMMGKFSGVVKDLMIAIKDYGHYVQPMLANTNGWKIGGLFLEMTGVNIYSAQDIENVRLASAPYAILRDTGTSKIASVGFALRLGSTTSILLYLNPVSGYTGSVTAYLEGSSENVAVRQPSGQYIVEIDYIPAHELHKVNRITVNAGGSFEIQVSALSYVDTMLNKEGIGQDVKEAVTSLYKYWDAAMKYKAASGR